MASYTIRYKETYSILEGLYSVLDELGSGGFGKVKLGIHLLTGQKVAIKIIDKKAVGDDLPRVKVEIEALKMLSHQNICRLYQTLETDQKFFIIMEYCSGGEMFDYIVKKERLEESEARHFFRQLVQAVAYVHSMGFAHRDLKPENLLLTDDLQLKLIDFGLCAKPEHGLNEQLQTCCGSPAYAAPELIQGRSYHGGIADIWSMGVLLYALLCGKLPFEDDNIQILYRKILKGTYNEPEYLSRETKDFLQKLLKVNPEERIKIDQLIGERWLNKKYSQVLRWKSIYDWNLVDSEICNELAHYFNKSTLEMEKMIKEWKFDYLTATYHILFQQKRKGLKIALPISKYSITDPCKKLISSPTVHASLENDLDSSGLDDDMFTTITDDMENFKDDQKLEDNKENYKDSLEAIHAKPIRTYDKNASYVKAVLDMPTVFTGYSPQRRLCNFQDLNPTMRYDNCALPPFVTPLRQYVKTNPNYDKRIYYRASDKENLGSANLRTNGPVRVSHEGRPKSNLYATPLKYFQSPASHLYGSTRIRVRSCSRDRSGSSTPVPMLGSRLPRSEVKTPRLRQRVFASLERRADKVFNLLTPKKIKNCLPEVLKQTKTMVNVSITSSKNPERVRAELLKIFSDQQLTVEEHGWKICGRNRDEFNRVMKVELEIVLIEMGNKENLVGVKRKRLCGDAFLYKKVCEEVLQLAGL